MATQQGRAKHGSQAWQRERKKMVADAIDVSCFFGDLYVPE